MPVNGIFPHRYLMTSDISPWNDVLRWNVMRLFTAINFCDTVKDNLGDVIGKLKTAGVDGRFSSRENLHLTLVFIGETNNTESIIKVMDKVNGVPFSIELSGLGVFRRKGGDIIWVGFKQNGDLQLIQKQLYDGLVRAGFTIEDREYTPHLTICRQVTYIRPVDFRALNEVLPVIETSVSTVDLMKSEQIRGRLTYTPIYTKALGRGIELTQK